TGVELYLVVFGTGVFAASTVGRIEIAQIHTHSFTGSAIIKPELDGFKSAQIHTPIALRVQEYFEATKGIGVLTAQFTAPCEIHWVDKFDLTITPGGGIVIQMNSVAAGTINRSE